MYIYLFFNLPNDKVLKPENLSYVFVKSYLLIYLLRCGESCLPRAS